MVAMHPQAESPLFCLPGEIREKIQRLALTPQNHADLVRSGTTKEREPLFISSSQPLPAIMSTCKKMYTEMSPFAFTEVIVFETTGGFSSRTGLICHGHLRCERLRRITMIIALEDIGAGSSSWSHYFIDLLRRSYNVEHLDIQFYKNEFQKEVERAVAEAKKRQEDGEADSDDELFLEFHAQPKWLQEIALQPSVRRVCFDGNVPTLWLENLRKLSEGRIQVFSDGIRFREQNPVSRNASANDGNEPPPQVSGEKDGSNGGPTQESPVPQFQITYEPASRFD